MFTPDKTFKKLAKSDSSRSCAYVYKDGVALLEDRRVHSGTYSTELEVWHVWKTEIPLRSRGDGEMKCKRIVVHNPAELLSGLESVEVWYNNHSEASKRDGIRITTVVLHAPNGMEWHDDLLPQIASNLTVQPNNLDAFGASYTGPDSIDSVVEMLKADYSNVENHTPQNLPESV